MVSLDPELSKLFLLLMSRSGPFGSQNGPTFPNFRKRKWETSFLQHESKIEDSLRFFPDYSPLFSIHQKLKLRKRLGLGRGYYAVPILNTFHGTGCWERLSDPNQRIENIFSSEKYSENIPSLPSTPLR